MKSSYLKQRSGKSKPSDTHLLLIYSPSVFGVVSVSVSGSSGVSVSDSTGVVTDTGVSTFVVTMDTGVVMDGVSSTYSTQSS